jgi:enhancing lycopene biosynthesis protein 2
MATKKIAVVLAGCGVFDGAEIHEATLTLFAIDKAGAIYQCFAPDINQAHVVNHLTGKAMNEARNVLVEAARIARGKIKPLSGFKADDFDALVFPGGFGVAKNLCTFAFDGVNCSVLPEVEAAVKSAAKAGKPIGALCIAPVMIAKILGNLDVTIGDEVGPAQAIEAFGGKHIETTHGEIVIDRKNKHIETTHGEIVIDRKNKVVTTPCYMLDATISQIAEGAEKLVKAVLDLVD